MIFNSSEILEQCDYQIIYGYDSDLLLATIKVTWEDKSYITKWSKSTKSLVNSFDNICCILPDAAASFTYLCLNKICIYHEYPFDLVKFVPKNQFCFDLIDYCDKNNSEYLLFLSKNLVQGKISPMDETECRSLDLEKEYSFLINYHLGTGVG
jgi:hypothetical protein